MTNPGFCELTHVACKSLGKWAVIKIVTAERENDTGIYHSQMTEHKQESFPHFRNMYVDYCLLLMNIFLVHLKQLFSGSKFPIFGLLSQSTRSVTLGFIITCHALGFLTESNKNEQYLKGIWKLLT